MSWQSADPIDRLIGMVGRKVGAGNWVKRGFVWFVIFYAVAIGTTSLKRVPWLKWARAPFEEIQKLSRTRQSWAMFYTVPALVEFNVVVHAGRPNLDGQVVSEEQLGPILPGFETFLQRESLRYYLCFNQMMTRDKYKKARTRYFRQLSAALEERNSSLEVPRSHFVLELVAASTVSPATVRETGKLSEPTSDRTQPYVIGSR